MRINRDKLSAQDLMNQAPWTVDEYLRGAVKYIDKTFGEGYAKNHPELVSAFILACVKDFSATMMANGIDDLSLTLSVGFDKISEAIRNDVF